MFPTRRDNAQQFAEEVTRFVRSRFGISMADHEARAAVAMVLGYVRGLPTWIDGIVGEAAGE